MGSGPESIRFLLQQLQCRPHTIRWSPPQPVFLQRGANKKLGFHFKTLLCQDNNRETVTVVVLVKDDCIIESGSLQVGNRIVGIGSVPVTRLDEAEVKHVFSQLQDSTVHLRVSAMSRADPSSQIKRFLSVNSGASGGSVTASVDSGERPQVKRFQKSSSTETSPPSSPSTDHELRPSDRVQPGVVETPLQKRSQLPVHKECAAYRPGFLSHSSHLFTNQYHSLPDRMEDDIVLPDDINLYEADDPNSLPPVLTPLPNIPIPSMTPHPGGAFVSTVSTGIGGASPISGDLVTGTLAHPRSLGVEVCRAPGCNFQKVCLWHKFVLTFPQYVIWEPFTKTVLLEKHDNSSFGFKYKVKKHDGPPAEVFALVTEVVSGGVAWTLLLPGDWIRSINGTPVNTAKEAFRQDFRNLSSLRLVIQRPEGLSRKGISKLKQVAHSVGVTLHIPLPPPTEASPSPQPSLSQNPRPALPRQNSLCSEQQPFSSIKAGSDAGSGMGVREKTSQADVLFDPLLNQYPRLAQSPGEHIPLNTLSGPVLVRSPSVCDRCPLPQARVVVCGAHGSAADLVRGLLGDCCGVDVDPDANVQSFRLSLDHSVDSGTYVHSQPESLVALMKECESYACGAGGGTQEGEGGLRCMNMELYVINDEQFFHHCCTWLLPTSSLLLLTFHVHKLLNQPQVETQRLAAMMHTLQACTDRSGVRTPQVLLYGVPSGSQPDVSAEEVQVMFYVTDSGSRLLEQHALAVNVAVPSCRKNMATTCQQLFFACQDHICKTPVPQCVARVVDSLGAVSGVKMGRAELSSLVTRALGDADPALVQTVINSLVDSGVLLVCGNSRPPSEADEQEYVLPFNMYQALSSLLIKSLLDSHTTESRQKWFKLMTTSRVSRSELQDLLASEASAVTIDILEQLGIVFKFHVSSTRGDSGFAEDAGVDLVIPYFLQDVRVEEESEGQEFVLRFERHMSWRGYYNMLCKLSALPATVEVVVRGQCDCVVRHNGLRLALHRKKDSRSDSVVVAVKRLHRNRESLTVQQLERLFSFVIPPTIPFKLLARDSTSPSSNLPSTDPGAATPTAKPSRPCAEAEQEETFVKPVVEAASCCPQEGETFNNLRLTALPWSVLNQAAILLTVTMATGHDWRSVAELAGKSMAEIYAYEAITSREVPAMSFLREWILTGTVQQFLDILEDLERPDVYDLILNYLREAKEGS